MSETRQLLDEYARHHSEAAFSEIVARYVGLVYSSALRMVDGDAHRAQDVAQVVFTDLARKAKELSPEVMLGGWLHRHACFVSANTMRGERRRLARERKAVAMNELHESSGAEFSRLAPLLDETINELQETDRNAILLRFFEQMDFRAIGESLETSEEAARKRVDRALDKLRALLEKRGVRTTAAALSVVIATEAVQAAPAGVAAAISATAIAASTMATTTATVTKIIAMTTLQKITVTAALAATVGMGVYEARQAHAARAEVQALQQQQVPLAKQVQQLQQERDDAVNRVVDLLAEYGKPESGVAQHELLKLRGQNSQLQTDARELRQVRASQKTAQGMMMDQARENRLKMVNFQVKTLSDTLGLTPAQTSGVKDLLTSAVDASLQVTSEVLTGDPQKDVILQKINDLQADQEAKIMALLTPDEQTAYKQWESDQAADNAKAFARREVPSMQTYLNLTPAQVDAANTALGSLPPRQDDGGTLGVMTGQAQSDLADETAALAQILTPEQLQTFQAKKQKEIATREAAVQMFKQAMK